MRNSSLLTIWTTKDKQVHDVPGVNPESQGQAWEGKTGAQ